MANLNLMYMLKEDSHVAEVTATDGRTAEVAYFEYDGNIIGHVATSDYASFTSLRAATVAEFLSQATSAISREWRVNSDDEMEDQ